jgi:hypothetical protein
MFHVYAIISHPALVTMMFPVYATISLPALAIIIFPVVASTSSNHGFRTLGYSSL